MWSQVRQVKSLRARCNYILGTYQCPFGMVVIWDVRNYSSDHFALWDRLLQSLARCHGSNLQGRRTLPLSLPATEQFPPADRKYQDLNSLNTTPPTLTRPPLPRWISETSTRLIDKCTALRHNPQHNRNVARTHKKSIRRPLLVESRCQ